MSQPFASQAAEFTPAYLPPWPTAEEVALASDAPARKSAEFPLAGQPCTPGHTEARDRCVASDRAAQGGAATADKPPAPATLPELHQRAGERSAGFLGLVGKVVRLPGNIYRRIKETIKKKYQKLSERYGPKMAVAVLASGQLVDLGTIAVSSALGAPLIIPGASVIGMAPMVGIAEVYRRLRGAPNAGKALGGVDLELVRELGAELVRSIYAGLERAARAGGKALAKSAQFPLEGQPCTPGHTKVRDHCVPASGDAVAASPVEGDRVLIDGKPFRRQGGRWVNEASPKFGVSDAFVEKQRQRGRVQAVEVPAPPSEPEPEPGPESEPGPKEPETPREEAAQETAAKLGDPSEYAFARQSEVPNAGEDILESARHKRNAWRGLEAAEGDGTADALVTRDLLFKNEPFDFQAGVDAGHPLETLAAYWAMNKFPAKPVGPGRLMEEEKRRVRELYYQSYQRLGKVAERVAKHLDAAIPGGGPRAVLDWLRTPIMEIADSYRKMYYRNELSRNAYAALYNGMVKMHNSLLPGRSKKSVAYQLGEFSLAAKKAYGDDPRQWDLDKIGGHVRDILEGKSVNKAFGAVQKKEGKPDIASAYAQEVVRTGGREVSSDPESDSKFLVGGVGLRGIQFGNSMTDDERRHHLKHAAGAFADLADALGLPEQMVSMSGQVGLAFGARGRGNALAHYEPDMKVINLTRRGGVGSLAHEWGHAFDNLVAGGGARFMSSHSWGMPNDGLKRAYGKFDEAVRAYRSRLRGDLTRLVREKAVGRKYAEYLLSTHEIFARCFERHVQDRLHSRGMEDTYLVSLKKKNPDPVFGSIWPTEAETAAMAPAFDAIFDEFRRRGKSMRQLAAEARFKSLDVPPSPFRKNITGERRDRLGRRRCYRDGVLVPCPPRGQQQGQEQAGRRGGDSPEAVAERAAAEWKIRGVKAPAFKAWFGDWEGDPANASKIVDAEGRPQESHAYSAVTNEDGEPALVYHGTTHEFNVFTHDFGNPENDLGMGFYFTESRDDAHRNYAGEGPDLTSRIDQLSDQYRDGVDRDIYAVLPDGGDFGDVEDEVRGLLDGLEGVHDVEAAVRALREAYESGLEEREIGEVIARSQLSGGKQRIIGAYLNIRKPVVIGDWRNEARDGTRFEIELLEEDAEGRRPDDPDFDPDTSEIFGESGSGVELVEAVRRVAGRSEYDGVDAQQVIDDLMNPPKNLGGASGRVSYGLYGSYGGLTAAQAARVMKSSDGMMDAGYTKSDGTRSSAGGQFVADVFQELGFDGVVYLDASKHFPNMGISPGARHFIAWRPEQVKSADNRGTFDPSDPDMTKGLKAGVTGRRRDRLGRERCYQDGKLVHCPDKPGAAKPRPTAQVSPALRLRKSDQRAFEGRQRTVRNPLPKQAAGKLGEDIVVAWLKSRGMVDAHAMNLDRNNFPVDLIQDHELIEVKTGQAGNSPGAQQWRLTIGEPGKAEKEWLKTASAEEKAQWNLRKQRLIHKRKEAVLRKLEKELGYSAQMATVTIIIDPDRRVADIFRFDGMHDRIGWNSEMARRAYVGSYSYGE